MESPEDVGQISKYNDAWLSISRLNEHWLNCKKYLRGGNFKKCKFELDLVWLELFTDVLRQESKKDIIRRNIESRKILSLAKTKSDFFLALMERYQFLREVQDVAGKAGVYIDEDEEGFE